MRISTTQIYRSGLDAMQRSQQQVNYATLQLASGKRIVTPSDDPSGATQVSQFATRIKATEQYQRNTDMARARLEQTESNIMTLNSHLERAKELVVAGSNGTQSTETRRYIAGELRELRDSMYEIANSREANGEYVFAGTRSLQSAFIADGNGKVSYVGARGAGAVRELAISDTWSMPIGNTGEELFMRIPETSGMLINTDPKVMLPDNTGANPNVPLDVMAVEVADIDEAMDHRGESFTIWFSSKATATVVPAPPAPPAPAGTLAVTIEPAEGVENQRQALAYADATFNVVFTDDGAGGFNYEVQDDTGAPWNDPVTGLPVAGAYIDPMEIVFAGRNLSVSGVPADGDSIASGPSANPDDMEYTILVGESELDTPGEPYLGPDGQPVRGTYVPGYPIEFAGRGMTVTGTPAPEDRVVSRPQKYADIFETLDRIATALEQPLTSDDDREDFSIESSIALANLSGTLTHFNDIRTTVGFRLQVVDDQTTLNDDRLLQLKTSRAEIEDLDYAEAISRFKLHETALQAAQQTYVQVNKLSLFNFL